MQRVSGDIQDNRTKMRLSKNCLNTPWKGPMDLLNRRALRVAKGPPSMEERFVRPIKDVR